MTISCPILPLGFFFCALFSFWNVSLSWGQWLYTLLGYIWYYLELCMFYPHNHIQECSASFFYLFKSLHCSKVRSSLISCGNEPLLTPWHSRCLLFLHSSWHVLPTPCPCLLAPSLLHSHLSVHVNPPDNKSLRECSKSSAFLHLQYPPQCYDWTMIHLGLLGQGHLLTSWETFSVP